MHLIKRICTTVALVTISVGDAFAESSLTIYNQDFAVVRDLVKLNLNQGENRLAYTDITAHLEPGSVMLRDPAGKTAIMILEQNYRADPVSEQLLLSLYEGQTIDFLIQKEKEPEIKKGKIIRSGYTPHSQGLARYGSDYRRRQMAYAGGAGGQPIIEVDGNLRFSLPGTPLFPALKDAAILKPTLHWILEADRGVDAPLELAYVTGGMSWEADYNVVAPVTGDILDIVGWVTMDNQSGKTFEDAAIKLMAGDVSKIQPGEDDRLSKRALYAAPSASAGRPPVTEKTFDEYHLYTLSRRTTLRDRETKQVEFLRAEGVRSQLVYIYDGADLDRPRHRNWDPESIRRNREYGTASNPKIWVMREFKNSEDNRLGMPLPRGRVRFYRQDDDRQLEFTGENLLDHTPKDELIRVYTGNAFDLAGERKRTSYKTNSSEDWLDESFEIKLRNHKKVDVEIRVVEHLYRWSNWEIVEKSDAFVQTESQTIEFRVNLKPDEEKTITYKAHYSW